jgi:hypothetical protein
MRQGTVAGWFALLLACASCADGEPAVSERDSGAHAADAAAGDAGTNPTARDAGQPASVDASVDLHFLLITALLEMERTLVVRCPCLTANEQYESESECRRAVNLGRSWIDCVNQLDLSAYDELATRENLRCNIAELSLRTECLMVSACSDSAVAMCMTKSLGCSVLPFELISEVVSACKIALSR